MARITRTCCILSLIAITIYFLLFRFINTEVDISTYSGVWFDTKPNNRQSSEIFGLYLVSDNMLAYYDLKADYPNCNVFYLSRTAPVIFGFKDGNVTFLRIGRSIKNEYNVSRRSEWIFGVSSLSKIWGFVKSDFDRAKIPLPWQASYIAKSSFSDSVKVLTIPYDNGPQLAKYTEEKYKLLIADFGENGKRFKILCHYKDNVNVGIEFVKE